MKNGDKPITAYQFEGYPSHETVIQSEGAVIGLTKREYFAGLAMQGLLASTNGGYSGTVIAESSVTMADKLLDALETK